MNILKIFTEKRKVGNFGEDSAARFLKKDGYKILERNYVGEGAEIDIIALKDNTVVFVEVKTRDNGRQSPKEPRPASSVTPEKQRKIISASRSYIGKNTYGKRRRFDVIEVYIQKTEKGERVSDIKHLVNTFDINTAYSKHGFKI